MKKSLMMRGMVLMHYGITVLLFVSCWWLFYRHIAAGAVFGAVNISVYAFYAVSLLMLSRILFACTSMDKGRRICLCGGNDGEYVGKACPHQ